MVAFNASQNLWLTADLHLGHRNIITYSGRPFADVEAMNLGLMREWNQTISDTDVVLCLGDMAMGMISETLPLYKSMKGRKILVVGNHDRCYPKGYRDPDYWREIYQGVGFEEIYFELELFTPKGLVYVNHIPYRSFDPGHTRSAYEAKKCIVPEDHGVPMFCGHVHEKWKTQRSLKGTPMVNVGVDVWGLRPVHISEALEVLFESPT